MIKTYLRTDKSSPLWLTKNVSHNGDVSFIGGDKTYHYEDIYIADDNEFTIYNADIMPINIVHFHGRSLQAYDEFQQVILNNTHIGHKPDDLDVITCWTDPDRCIIKQQLDIRGIPLTNAAKDIRTEDWSMPDKIRYYIKALEKSDKKIVLLLDGYDTIIVTFDDMLRKFYNTGLRVLFNATRNNYPNIDIDYVPYRRLRGLAKYFNAGCCIGYREDVLKFYKEALEYITLKNPYNSEQFILRHAFARYSSNIGNKFVDFDYRNDIFQLLCKTAISKPSENKYIIL